MSSKFVNSINEVVAEPVTILLYPPGSSGEFIAWALTQSIPSITPAEQSWENVTRCKYTDALGRTLSVLDQTPDEKIIERYNIFLNLNQKRKFSLALAHDNDVALGLIKKYFLSWPVLEITIKLPASIEFAYQSKLNKITARDLRMSEEEHLNRKPVKGQPYPHGYVAKKHLKIEWQELMLSDCKQQFKIICDFFGCDGNFEIFQNLITDYCERNKFYIDNVRCLLGSAPP